MSSRRAQRPDSDTDMEVGDVQPSQSAQLAYDPDQEPEEKRKVRAQYRRLLGEQIEHRTDLNNLTVDQLLKTQKRADEYFQKVRAPQEAALDSKVMLQNAEMGAAMARAMKHDTEAFDIDDLIGKLITFMGGRSADGDVSDSQDVEMDDTAPLNWELIGQKAYMYSRKPPCMDFMVGPLSIEVKQRKKVVRSRLEKDKRLEVQPVQLKADDIQRSENETTKMVREISYLLGKIGDDGVNFLEFFINPESFGQSVENLFYVSFLVREGRAAIYPNEENHNLLTLYAAAPPSVDEESVKQQQVFRFSPKEWREAKELFNITKSIIPHRHRPEEYDDEVKDYQFLI